MWTNLFKGFVLDILFKISEFLHLQSLDNRENCLKTRTLSPKKAKNEFSDTPANWLLV